MPSKTDKKTEENIPGIQHSFYKIYQKQNAHSFLERDNDQLLSLDLLLLFGVMQEESDENPGEIKLRIEIWKLNLIWGYDISFYF